MTSSFDGFSQNSPRVALGQIATLFLLLGLWATHVMFAQPAASAAAASPAVQLASASAATVPAILVKQ